MNHTCGIYNTDFLQLSEMHGMETEGIQFGNVGLLITDLSYKVWSKEGIENPEHGIFTRMVTKIVVEVCSRIKPLEVHEDIF